MGIELDITFNEESFERLKKLADRMGHRNLSHTLALATALLEIAIEAVDGGKEIGILERRADSKRVFRQLFLPRVKKVQKDDVFCGLVIKCENCKKNFSLTEGTVYRENVEHEGARHIDCPHCTYGEEF